MKRGLRVTNSRCGEYLDGLFGLPGKAAVVTGVVIPVDGGFLVDKI